MDCEYKTVLIIGHSFVWRMEEFLREGRDRRALIDFNFQPAGSVFIQYDGVGGRRLSEWSVAGQGRLEAMQPDVVILEMGSNDLAAGRLYDAVADDLVVFSKYLQERCAVKHVVVSQILHRDLTRATLRWIVRNETRLWYTS